MLAAPLGRSETSEWLWAPFSAGQWLEEDKRVPSFWKRKEKEKRASPELVNSAASERQVRSETDCLVIHLVSFSLSLSLVNEECSSLYHIALKP